MKIRELLEDGRIVKGVNTTVDVGVDQTKIEAAKYGNRVTRDGFPPTLNSNGKVNENLTAYQQAIIEGGHTLEDPRFSFLKDIQDVELDEGIKDTLRRLAMAGSLGAVAAGGVATKQAYDDMYKNQPAAISQTANTKPTQQPAKNSTVSQTPTTAKKSDLAPSTSVRPIARPSKDKETSVRPKEKPSLKNRGPFSSYLYNEAIKNGITGVELIALMAQAAQETGKFKRLAELGDSEYFQRYDPKFSPNTAAILGNDFSGEGEKYKGRGFLHTTGKYNYAEVGNALGLPLVKQPELLENPKIAAKTSVWFWLNKVRPSVTDFTDVTAVTRKINPKLNALDEREQFFQDYTELVSRFSKN